MNDLITYIILFTTGVITFSLSTLTAGGGGLMLIPTVNALTNSSIAAPIINFGNAIGRPVRLIIFWKHIYWKVTLYYVLPALPSTLLAGYLFSSIKIEWLKIIIGLFLISTIFQFRFGKKPIGFKTKDWHFILLGLFVPFIGTLTGGMGPVLNPFFLNIGLSKEELIATKTANSFFVGLLQIGTYVGFGLLTKEVVFMGISLGLGISFGNYIGKKLLAKISDKSFLKFVIWSLVITGITMIVNTILKLIN